MKHSIKPILLSYFQLCTVAAIFSFLLSGCFGLKNISSEDPLLVGQKIKFTEGSPVNNSTILDLNRVLQPTSNTKFLWMRPSLAIYNTISDSAKTKKFWKNKISEPVKISQAEPDQITRAITNRMFNNGYFHSITTFDTLRIGKRRAKYQYNITINKPYRLGEIQYPEPSEDLNKSIHDAGVMDNSLLKTGDVYSLQSITEERDRINEYLEEKGYIYFNPEFILFLADTLSENNIVNMKISVKPETPPESRKPYSIGKIYIQDDFGIAGFAPDTLDFDSYFLISKNNNLKFDALKRGIFLEPGQRYAREDHIQTIRYLGNLPIIRNASIKFMQVNNEDLLNPIIYLNQKKRYAYTAEVNTIFRSTNYFGPGVIFSYTDRNANKGAEQFKVNLRGRFEVQISDGVVNPAFELGLEGNYTLPKLFPGIISNIGRAKLPRTNISLGYNLFNRLDLYRLNSLFTDIGYKWSRNDNIGHTLNPLEIVFTVIPEESKSDAFRAYLLENPGVQRSFDEQFVMGSSYGFTYDSDAKTNSQFFFRGGIDLAGNSLSLIYKAANAATDSSGRYTLFGIPFSQFMRLKTDFRYSYSFSKNNSIASRFISGLGIPFGNSSTIPYIRQYYVGGTNSLRSFVARSVGPGSETPPEGFNDLTGDIHLEWNLEYRFTFVGKFKGALFVDSGNIWLFNKDPSRPEGNFRFDTFLNQVAVSSGWGLRWDFDYLIARLDFAYSLRIPYLPEGKRWVKNVNLWKPVINIAIGYPF